MDIICTAIWANLSNLIQALPASTSIAGKEISFQTIGFISFGLTIILFLFVPAAILFAGLVAGMIRRKDRNSDKEFARDIKVP